MVESNGQSNGRRIERSDDHSTTVHARRFPSPSVRELAQVFKLLSDETRLRILLYLAQSQRDCT